SPALTLTCASPQSTSLQSASQVADSPPWSHDSTLWCLKPSPQTAFLHSVVQSSVSSMSPSSHSSPGSRSPSPQVGGGGGSPVLPVEGSPEVLAVVGSEVCVEVSPVRSVVLDVGIDEV